MKGEEAVRRLAAGEPDALDAVSAAYTPLLNYVIFAILEDKQEREECLADVLHQVWQAREQFDAKRAASPPGLPPWHGTRPSTEKEHSAAGRQGERSGMRSCPTPGTARRSSF